MNKTVSRIAGNWFVPILGKLSSFFSTFQKKTDAIFGEEFDLSMTSAIMSVECVPPHRVACGCIDGIIRMYNLLSAKLECKVKSHFKPVVALLLMKKHLRLISASFDKTILIYRYEVLDREFRMNRQSKLYSHRSPVRTLAKITNTRFASGSYNDGEIREIFSGQCLGRFNHHRHNINALAFFNNKLLSGSFDKTVKFRDFKTKKTQIVANFASAVSALLINQKNGHLIIGQANGSIDEIDFLDPKKSTVVICQYIGPDSGWVSSIIYFGNHRYLISSSSYGKIIVFRVPSFFVPHHKQKYIQLITCHKGAVHSVISYGNKHIISCSQDKSIRLFKCNEIICLEFQEILFQECLYWAEDSGNLCDLEITWPKKKITKKIDT